MYYPQIFIGWQYDKILAAIKAEGFNPIKITDQPNFVYSLHSHPETKLLVFLQGEMDVYVNDQSCICKAGDKLIIPGNTPHSAVVGNSGCQFLWSEKLISS